MAKEIERGDIWLLQLAPPDRRRPVLVLSRPALVRVLSTVIVTAITTSLHGSPTEVVLGAEEGLKTTSCANLSNLFTVRQADLRHYVGAVSGEKMTTVCRALVLACGCD